MPPGEDFLRDMDGNPVRDEQGHPLAVQSGTSIQEVGDDGRLPSNHNTPPIDKFGKGALLRFMQRDMKIS